MFSHMVCYLTDKDGNILDPFSPDSIHYTYRPLGSCRDVNFLAVCIQGYVTVFIDGKAFAPPIFFCIESLLKLRVPRNAAIFFTTTGFHCQIVPIFCQSNQKLEKVEICVEIKACARSSQPCSLFLLPPGNCCSCTMDSTLVRAEKVFDFRSLKGSTAVPFNPLLKAETTYYVASSSGDKKEYTDQDLLPEYDSGGILPPETVSYYHVFVNGMLQPKSNYSLRQGFLNFNTLDMPSKNVFIVIQFVTFKSLSGDVLPAEVDYYVTRTEENRRIYTDTDALPLYSSKGIPGLQEVSFFNFYANGPLQPKSNYLVRQGQLELISEDLPPSGTFLILEFISLKTPCEEVLHGEIEQYNALSDGGKIYRSESGYPGIPAPQDTSYQKLVVNSLLQPPINYSVQRGLLQLKTGDAPLNNSPLTLQSVSFQLP